MEYKFHVNNNGVLTINDEGIRIKRDKTESPNLDQTKITYDCFAPYSAITKVKFTLGAFDVFFNVGYEEYNCFVGLLDKADKKQVKALLPKIEALVKSSPKKRDGIAYDKNTVITYRDGDNVEYYVRCNVCGNILSFTNQDLIENEKTKQLMKGYRLGAAAGALGGNSMTSRMDNNRANELKDKLLDYTKCPKCNSSDVEEVTKEEAVQKKSNPNVAQSTVSAADELKKFKELLDMGVITQEEFDAKKKQLLGL